MTNRDRLAEMRQRKAEEAQARHKTGVAWDAVLVASSGDIRRLASVWRYSSIPICIPENVADHSYWVALYSVAIHDEVINQSPNAQRKKYSKRDVLLAIVLKALVHDMGEAVTGDIVRPFKYSTEALKKAVDEAEHTMMGERLPKSLTKIASDAGKIASEADASTYVEAIVKAADFMSLYQFMRREILRGNVEIVGFVGRMCEDFGKMCSAPHLSYPFDVLEPYYRCLEKNAKVLHSMAAKSKAGIY